MPKIKSLFDSFCLNIVIFACNIRLDHETSKNELTAIVNDPYDYYKSYYNESP